MAKYVLEVRDSLNPNDIVWVLTNYLRIKVKLTKYEADTGTRNSQKPDRRQSTRRLHDSAQKRLKK